MAVVLQECWPLFLLFVAILLWIFPDGMLPSGRWHRRSVVLVVVGLLVGVFIVPVAMGEAPGWGTQAVGALSTVGTAALPVCLGWLDLDALRHDLVGVTHEAFQPAHVSMWLAPAPAGEADRPS